MTTQALLQPLKRAFLAMVLIGFACLQIFTSNPAQAEEAKSYIDPEGRDLTAFVECLPDEYGKGNLQTALGKFGNDFLERVFRLKENTEDYKVSAAEKELQQCLKSKGIRPKS
ncbi:MAG: hypothetical protein ACLFQP_11170 [Halothece sp.]